MKFSVEVGKKEKHVIDYSFNKFWGNISIKVDGETVKTDFVMYSLQLTTFYEFEIGETEKHKIRIVKERPLFFAGFRSNTYRVLVDGRLFKEFRD